MRLQLSISLILIALIGFVGNTFSQAIPIGDWRDHLPYSNAISVSYGNQKVYCASKSAVFVYDMVEYSIERLNLVNGLSDIGINKIKYVASNNKLIVAYENGNIDIVDQNNSITNLSFLKNSNIIGSKAINNIYLQGSLAYLSTGFGIVVLNTNALEIEDTYLIADLGAYVNVNDITIDNTSIYAATADGVYYAPKASGNLADYNLWNKLTPFLTGEFSSIATYSNHLFVASDIAAYNGDSLYYNPGGNWQKFLPNGSNIRGLKVAQNKLLVNFEIGADRYNTSLTKEAGISSYRNQFSIRPMEVDLTPDLQFLFAEEDHGLIKAVNTWTNEIIVPNGPSSSNAFNMDFLSGELWTVSGGFSLGQKDNLVNHSVSSEWRNLGKNIKDIDGVNATDMVSVAINPSNSSNVFVGSWADGLFEYNNDAVSNIYTAANSVLDSTFFGSTAIGATTFDGDNNLWVSSSFTNNILAVKTPSNNWYSYSFQGLSSTQEFYTDIIIDENNYKWILAPDAHKVIVFDDNGTLDNTSDDRVISNNNMPGTETACIVKDLDNEIWVGTDEGIAVYYNPNDVFDANINAEQILIQQDGITQILLLTEFITSIAIDGANRKWIGTQNSGVFLMSADGTEEVEHFTTTNSPLFSNNIFDIVIDPETGEVYFGTEKGLISYKGTATEAKENFENIFVYPNPVKPDFTGKIAIRGLVKDTDVRITDISGNIVYKTQSLGGQAIWDGKDFNGNKVQTGVYMVFNGSQDGVQKAAAKILFIN